MCRQVTQKLTLADRSAGQAALPRMRAPALSACLRTWIDRSDVRKALRKLAEDKHALKDIGFTREQVLSEATKPFWREIQLKREAVPALNPTHKSERRMVMPDPIVFGFVHSTYVHIVRLILTHKSVPYTFRDLETEMGKPTHLALHPFNRVPAMQHGDFTVYETSAIATYIDETFEKPPLQPKNARDRSRMHQWISSVNSYYYYYMIYHVTHERRVFPELGIASDEKVVAHALPKIEVGLQVLERQLAHGKEYVLGADLTIADFYLLPCTYSFGQVDEGKAMYPKYPAVCRWRETMEALPTVRRYRASLPPRAPIEHAREWAISHRPKY